VTPAAIALDDLVAWLQWMKALVALGADEQTLADANEVGRNLSRAFIAVAS
jgi:hypothetical protein